MTKEEVFESYAQAVCDRFKVNADNQLFKKKPNNEMWWMRDTHYTICAIKDLCG